MIEHVTAWLGAYHDGELQGRRLRQVETHLASCATCRAELEELRMLTALLQESPVAEGLVRPERFVAQVGLRLPRRPTQPAWKRALESGWLLTPVGLLGAWVFVQAVFFVAKLVLLGLRAGLGDDLVAGLLPAAQQETWLPSILSYLGASLSDSSMTAVRSLSTVGWSFILNLVLLAVIGLLYWSWLASWWARRQRSNGEME